jgi:F420-dependent oxidoreductase-like protein
MRFSVWMRARDPWPVLDEEARHIEASGWDGVWVADHFMPQDGKPAEAPREAWAILAGLAAVTSRVRLGPLVCGNTYRHPAILANTAATVDVMTNGRVVLGLGAGWQQNEHDAYGIELPGVKERMDRLEEACQVIRAVTGAEPGTFKGHYYQVADAFTGARPVNSPLRLLIGGSGEKRSLKIAARYADEWNTWGGPDVMKHKGSVLDRHCETVGRDPAAVARSCQVIFDFADDPCFGGAAVPAQSGSVSELQAVMQAYVDVGVDEVVVPERFWGTGQQRLDRLDRFLTEVAAPFRDAP